MSGPDFYPSEENLGKDCRYWALGGLATGCCYPKARMQGRRSCEGVIDDVCLFLKNGRRPDSLTEEQIMELKIRAPNDDYTFHIPPGDIV